MVAMASLRGGDVMAAPVTIIKGLCVILRRETPNGVSRIKIINLD